MTTIHDAARVASVSTADAPDGVARQAAFEHAVAATPDSGIDQVIHGDFSEDSGVAAARLLLGRTTLPQAVACANDQMAIGLAPRTEILPTQVVIRTSCGCPPRED